MLYTYIDQTLVKLLQESLNCEIGGLDYHVITVQNTCPLNTHVTPIL